MPRIKQLNVDESSFYTKKLFDKVEKGLGLIPNMFKCMGNSDTALEGFLTLNANLGAGKLGPKLIKMIILATSELNGCEYCVSAHTQLAKNANLMNDEECLNVRRFKSTDTKSQTMLDFVKKVYETKGKVSNNDIQKVKNAGFEDAEIVEILGTMALISFANYVSNVGEPELDFPEAPKV